MHRHRHHTQAGVTLLEIIVTIVLFGIVASYLVSYINSTLPESHNAYIWVSQENDIGNEMEDLITEYIKEVNRTDSDFDISSFNSSLDLSGSNYSTVAKQFVCFNDSGVMSTSGCGQDDVLMVSVTDPNGRVQYSLFTQTRTASEPYRIH